MKLKTRDDILLALDTVLLFTLDSGVRDSGDKQSSGLTNAIRERLLTYMAMSIVTESLGDEKYIRDTLVVAHEKLDVLVAKASANARDFIRKGGLK